MPGVPHRRYYCIRPCILLIHAHVSLAKKYVLNISWENKSYAIFSKTYCVFRLLFSVSACIMIMIIMPLLFTHPMCMYTTVRLTVMEYMCHKWPLVVNTSRSFHHAWLITGFVTRLTRVSLVAGIAYPSGAPEFTPVISGVRVTRSLVSYVCFVDRCLYFCLILFLLAIVLSVLLSFSHCVFYPSSIYGFS